MLFYKFIQLLLLLLLQLNGCLQVYSQTQNYSMINISDCSSSSLLPAAAADQVYDDDNQNSLFVPNCTINTINLIHSECVGHQSIKIWLKPRGGNALIHCTSNKYMKVDVIFNNGLPFPNLKDTYIKLERFSGNILDNGSSTFTYSVKLSPDTRITRYIIGHQNDDTLYNFNKNNSISVMIFYGNIWKNGAYWMANTNFNVSIFEATQEIITIPCVPELQYIPGMLNIVEENKSGIAPGDENLIPLHVDNTSITYEPSIGFQFNTTTFPDYKKHLFRCLPIDTKNLQWDFRIIDLPDLKVTPPMPTDGSDDVIRLFATLKRNKAPFKLECNYKNPIRLQGILKTNIADEPNWLTNFYRDKSPLLIWNDESHEIDIKNNTKYKTITLPSTRYIGIYEMELNVFDKLMVQCVNESDDRILYNWTVQVHDSGPQKTSPGYLKFVYPTNNKISNSSTDYEYQCYSNIYNDIRLRSIRCRNIFQCEFLKKCFNNDYRCLQIVTEGSRCPESFWQPVTSCQQSHALIPGELIMCSGGGHEFIQLNFVGFDDIIYNYYDIFPRDAVIDIEFPENDTFYTKVYYTFTCKVHSFFSEGQSRILFAHFNNTIYEPENRKWHSKKSANEFSPYSESENILIESSGVYRIFCSTPRLFSAYGWINSPIYSIIVKESLPPEILTNDDGDDDELIRNFDEGSEGQTIECKVTGIPIPSIKWTNMGKEIEPPMEIIDVSNDTKILKFPKFSNTMVGVYTCTGSNVAGNISKEFEVSIKKDKKITVAIISIIAGIILMLVPFLLIFHRYRKAKKLSIKMDETELDAFLNGCPKSENDLDDDSKNLSQLPFKKEFEIKYEQIRSIDKTMCLGSGEFGEVYLGNLINYDVPVAIKMTKKNCPDDIFAALRKELKIMIYLESHMNIVQLIGAYIAEIQTGKLYIITEFCENGSLEDYLKKNACYYGEMVGDTKVQNNSSYAAAGVFMSFGFKELLRWSAEIASGMEFLSSIKIVHMDLAARNILLKANLTSKISDFGLSRRLYERMDYIKMGKEPLPWRWLAIECLESNTFSTHSDVWAYGILLWEIFSLGNEPYPGLNWNIEFGKQLKNGLRNLIPKYATHEIYQIMEKCWNDIPQQRPTFSYLYNFFIDDSNLLDKNEQHAEHYIFSSQI